MKAEDSTLFLRNIDRKNFNQGWVNILAIRVSLQGVCPDLQFSMGGAILNI